MKFKKILHYVRYSFEGRPSFVIRMSDGKEYISNGCVFTESTEENIQELIYEYDCKKQLDELFQAQAIAIEDLVDGSFMFYNAPITEFHNDMPKLEDGGCMFAYSRLKSFTGDILKLEDGSGMFAYSKLNSFNGDLPSLVYGVSMFQHSKLELIKTSMPVLKDNRDMFDGCANLNKETQNAYRFV